MQAPADYYQVLGLKPSATAAEIKAAYHAAAKRSHPDAGGSAEAMRLVNEAHAVLSDLARRRDYDRQQEAVAAGRAAAPAAGSGSDTAPSSPRRSSPPNPRADPEYRRALAYARRDSFKWLAYSLLGAVILVPAAPLLAAHTTDPSAKTVFALIAFAPVYGLAVSSIFLTQPELRLALMAVGQRGFRLHPHHRITLISMTLAAIPLAAIWVLLMKLGVIH